MLSLPERSKPEEKSHECGKENVKLDMYEVEANLRTNHVNNLA